MDNNLKKTNYQALILSAGYGKRMLPLTLLTPKPLINLLGKPIITYSLKQLENNNISSCFINSHHLSDKIELFVAEYLKKNSLINIHTSYEKEILDTGGAIKNINDINSDNLIVINGDSIIINTNHHNPIKVLKENFDPVQMDALLLLDNYKNSIGYEGQGDFVLKKNNNLDLIERIGKQTKGSLAFTGWQILNPKIVKNINKKKFSLNYFFDQAIRNNRLCGLINKNKWLHIGNLESLKESSIWLEKFKL